jgi:hypothetical protein
LIGCSCRRVSSTFNSDLYSPLQATSDGVGT